MGVYAVTGSASGMGLKVAQKLCDAEHTVIGVDLKQADIVADLSTGEGRRAAIDRVLAASGQTGRRRASGRSRARPGRRPTAPDRPG